MYETGVGFAFILWVVSMGGLFVSLHSQMERNLNKVGYRLSWITLAPKPMGNEYYKRSFLGKTLKFVLISLSGLISIFFSWLYVAFVIGSFIYSRMKDVGAPQVVREFRWRMKNMDLTFDQVAEGMALVAGATTNVDQLKRELRDEMVERGNA